MPSFDSAANAAAPPARARASTTTSSAGRCESVARCPTSDHCRAGGSYSNTSAGSLMPRSSRCRENLGRSPVDLSLPRNRPSSSTPARVVEVGDVLHDDRLALHALDLGDVRDASAAVAESGEMDDEIQRRDDLLANRANGQVVAGHEHHRLEARHRVSAASSRGRCRASRRGRCSSPAACRAPRRHAPRRR